MPYLDFKILRADIDDVKELLNISITTFCDAFAEQNKKEDMDMYLEQNMNLLQLTEELMEISNHFFIVKAGNRIIGYAKMRTSVIPSELIGHNPIEIERLYILKEFQNNKIGKALMNYCTNYAINNGFMSIWLGVWECNQNAIRFYKKLGFEKFGTHPFLLGNDGQTDELMQLNLLYDK